MNRTALLCVSALAAAVLHAQGFPRQPKAFPPDIGPAMVTVTGIDSKAIDLTAADLASPPHTP
jgi:hypothetical protein